jgi:hypothetical protein
MLATAMIDVIRGEWRAGIAILARARDGRR